MSDFEWDAAKDKVNRAKHGIGFDLAQQAEKALDKTTPLDTQVAVLTMLALYLGRMRHLSSLQGARMLDELRALPDAVRRTLGSLAQS